MALNKNELKVKAKEIFVAENEFFSEDKRCIVGANATSRDFQYVTMVEVEGNLIPVCCTLTTPQWWDTKSTEAFDFDEAHEAYNEDKEFQAQKAEADRKAKEEKAKLKEAKKRK